MDREPKMYGLYREENEAAPIRSKYTRICLRLKFSSFILQTDANKNVIQLTD